MARTNMLALLLTLSSLYSVAYSFAVAKNAYRKSANISTTPLKPRDDPWYAAPPNFAAAAPGAVLKVRVAPDVTKILTNCSMAYNVLYRTTDSRYMPTWAVTTLYLPLASPANGTNSTTSSDGIGSSAYNATNATDSDYSPGAYLLSYQTPYDSANVDLSPSYTVYGGALNTYGIPGLLGRGWYVSVPDYEGPNASFTAGVQSGHATLDSVRAILNTGFGLNEDAKYAMAGYSGGALASEWAAELQNQYAPELNFAAVSLGGLTPNVTSVLETINNSSFAELIPNGILGLTSQWPEAEAYLLSQLKDDGPYNKTTFLATRTSDNSDVYRGQNIYNYFKDGNGTILSDIFQKVSNIDGIMGFHGVPRMPTFAYKAIADQISPVKDTDQLIARYCSVGANILYERNTVGGHTAEFVNGQARSVQYLADAFAGKLESKYGKGCTVRNVTVAIFNSPI